VSHRGSKNHPESRLTRSDQLATFSSCWFMSPQMSLREGGARLLLVLKSRGLPSSGSLETVSSGSLVVPSLHVCCDDRPATDFPMANRTLPLAMFSKRPGFSRMGKVRRGGWLTMDTHLVWRLRWSRPVKHRRSRFHQCLVDACPATGRVGMQSTHRFHRTEYKNRNQSVTSLPPHGRFCRMEAQWVETMLNTWFCRSTH
jgi:hypothetical protein